MNDLFVCATASNSSLFCIIIKFNRAFHFSTLLPYTEDLLIQKIRQELKYKCYIPESNTDTCSQPRSMSKFIAKFKSEFLSSIWFFTTEDINFFQLPYRRYGNHFILLYRRRYNKMFFHLKIWFKMIL